jgi:hypothetical protein
VFTQHAGEGFAGEMTTLVGIEYFSCLQKRHSASWSASMQKSVSSMLETRQDSTLRECPSKMAAR